MRDGGAENGDELSGVFQFFGTADELVVIAGNDNDGGCVGDIEAFAEIEIGLDLGIERARGVDDEGQLLSMLLEPALDVLMEIVLAVIASWP